MPGDDNQSVLRFEHVSLAFDQTPALEDVSFRDPARERPGSFWEAPGSGKTVLLKTALGLLSPDSGRVLVFGQDITRMSEAELFDMRAKVGILFQEGGLFDSLTIEENVAYPLLNQRLLRVPAAEALPRVEEALQFVELEHTLEKFPSELSGGMRRRVGIARAVVSRAAAGALRLANGRLGSHHRPHHHLPHHQGQRPEEYDHRDRHPSLSGRDLARRFPIQSQKWAAGTGAA